MTALTSRAREIQSSDTYTRRQAIHIAVLEQHLPSGVAVKDCDIVPFAELGAGHVSGGYAYPDDDTPVVILPGWTADDGNADVTYEQAESGREAAQDYVDDGNWGEITKTDWVRVAAWRVGYMIDGDGDAVEIRVDKGEYRISLEPDEPECADDHEHEWRAPYSVVGGIRENPGVWGHGAGIVSRECCAHCGAYRVTDTWAQDMSDGTQGLTSIEYEAADDDSMAWVRRRAAPSMIAALEHIADVTEDDGRWRIRDYAPDSRDDAYLDDDGEPDTSPGSAWDEECNRRLDEINAALPTGWSAEWSDDDIRIDWDR